MNTIIINKVCNIDYYLKNNKAKYFTLINNQTIKHTSLLRVLLNK